MQPIYKSRTLIIYPDRIVTPGFPNKKQEILVSDIQEAKWGGNFRSGLLSCLALKNGRGVCFYVWSNKNQDALISYFEKFPEIKLHYLKLNKKVVLFLNIFLSIVTLIMFISLIFLIRSLFLNPF